MTVNANATPQTTASTTPNTSKWTTRDVLTFVAFNFIILLVTMVAKILEDMVLSPQNTFFVGSWLFPLLATPFYLVMADRIGKRGVLAATILVFGLLYTLTGGIYCLPIAIVGAIVGETIMWKKGSYRDPVHATIGYYVYWVTFAFYGVIPYLLFRDAYMAQLSNYYQASDVAAMVSQYTELPWILLMLVLFAVGTAVGGLIGARLLKKHVRKAKIA